jgi:RNase P subunit RPR2
MNRHDQAVDIIEARISALIKSSSGMLHGETSMAIEMAYTLGAIDIHLHRHYVARLGKIIEREQIELMRKIGVKV